jgi:hypothetical protein
MIGGSQQATTMLVLDHNSQFMVGALLMYGLCALEMNGVERDCAIVFMIFCFIFCLFMLCFGSQLVFRCCE